MPIIPQPFPVVGPDNITGVAGVDADGKQDPSQTLGIDLSTYDFSDFVNLNGLNFSGANLAGVNLSGRQAIATNFNGANLDGATL